MVIHTPADLATYLTSLASQHPRVKHVIYGEHSRSESETLATADYPQVEIETPAASIPVDQGPSQLSTRIFVVTSPGQTTEEEDISHAITFDIARDLINLVIKHTSSGFIDIELTLSPIQIRPIISKGSDQQRGWMFLLEFNVDNHLCIADLEYDEMVVPQFSWRIADNDLHIEDLTHGASLPGLEYTWYVQLADDDEPATTDISVAIDVSVIDPAARSIRVWLKTEYNGIVLWAFTHIVSSNTSGRSVSSVPFHPE